MSRHASWSSVESALDCPLVRYLRSLSPSGAIITIDTEEVARRLGWRKDTTAVELNELQRIGVLRYSADKGSRVISVRVP
jgi:hypothetical protein